MSLLAAFNRQRVGVKCKFCSVLVPADQIRRHQNSCSATVADEEECMVLSEHEVGDPDRTVLKSSPIPSSSRKRPLRSDLNTSGQDEDLQVPNTDLAETYHLRIFRAITEAGYKRARAFDIWSEQDKAAWQTWNGEDFDDNSRHIFVRLFIRKSDKWHPLEALQTQFGAIVKSSLEHLLKHQFIVSSTGSGGLKLINDVLPLLSLPQLRQLAKVFHLKSLSNKVTNKHELLDALRRHARQKNVFGQYIEESVVKRAVEVLGTCYRVPLNIERFFLCLFNLYSPPDMNTSQLVDSPQLNLKSQLLNLLRAADKGEQKYPMYDKVDMDSPLPLFTSNQQWNDFIDAQTEERNIAQWQQKQDWSSIWSLADTIRAKLTSHSKHIISVVEPKPSHIRQYTAEHVWTRCCWHAVEAAQRMRLYKQAVEMLEFLLSWPGGRCLCAEYAGRWFERLALNQQIHLKKFDEALWSIDRAFAHESVRDQTRLALYDRYEKLITKMESKPKPESLCQQLRDYRPPETPELYEFSAPTVGKELGDGERKNIFVDEDGKMLSVETVALNHYKHKYNLANGVHCEGACWHALLGLILWDVIHDFETSVADYIWLSPVQAQPIDLNHSREYPAFARSAAYTDCIIWLKAADQQELRNAVLNAWQYNFQVTCSFIAWDRFESVESLVDLAVCAGGKFLADLFDYMLRDFRFRRSGFPDLTLWDVDSSQVMVVEVKGPGDKLSTKQRIWLDYFAKNSIKAQVCHVRAESSKSLTSRVSSASPIEPL